MATIFARRTSWQLWPSMHRRNVTVAAVVIAAVLVLLA
jgi:hypothetical protein